MILKIQSPLNSGQVYYKVCLKIWIHFKNALPEKFDTFGYIFKTPFLNNWVHFENTLRNAHLMIGFKANSHLPLPALLSKCINSEIKMKNVFLNFLSRAGSIQVASMEKLFQISNINFKKSLNPYRILYECHSLWILELKTLLLPFFDDYEIFD